MLKADLFFGKKHFELATEFNLLTKYISELLSVARTTENYSDYLKLNELITSKIEEQQLLTVAMNKARAEYIEANKPSDVCPF